MQICLLAFSYTHRSFFKTYIQHTSDGQHLESNHQGFNYICADKVWLTFSCGLNQTSTTLANIFSKLFCLPKATGTMGQQATGSSTSGEPQASSSPLPKPTDTRGQQATRSSTSGEPQASSFLQPKPIDTRGQQATGSSITGEPQESCLTLPKSIDTSGQQVFGSSTSEESQAGDLPDNEPGHSLVSMEESIGGIPAEQPVIATDQVAGGPQISDVIFPIPLPTELAASASTKESSIEAVEAGSSLQCHCPFCNEEIDQSKSYPALSAKGVEGIQNAAKQRQDRNLKVFVGQKVHTVCRQKYNDPETRPTGPKSRALG